MFHEMIMMMMMMVSHTPKKMVIVSGIGKKNSKSWMNGYLFWIGENHSNCLPEKRMEKKTLTNEQTKSQKKMWQT